MWYSKPQPSHISLETMFIPADYILTTEVFGFHCAFSRHLSYLHDPGALGPFAGARPAQHEHNLRLHHQRRPVQEARHPLRHVSKQKADHKPPGREQKQHSGLTGECVSVSVGRKRVEAPSDTSSAVAGFDQWGCAEAWRRPRSRLLAPVIFFSVQRSGDAPPLPLQHQHLQTEHPDPAGGGGCSPVRDVRELAETQRRLTGKRQAVVTFVLPRCLHSWCTIHASPRMEAHREESIKISSYGSAASLL